MICIFYIIKTVGPILITVYSLYRRFKSLSAWFLANYLLWA